MKLQGKALVAHPQALILAKGIGSKTTLTRESLEPPRLLKGHLTRPLNGRKVLPKGPLKEFPLDRKGHKRARPFGLSLLLVPAKEKEKGSGKERGSPKEDVQVLPLHALIRGLHPEMTTSITCLLLQSTSPNALRIGESTAETESLFKGIVWLTTVKPIG